MELSKSAKERLKRNYGPWALITGSSSGIGQELAEQIAASGLNVILHGRNIGRLEVLADELVMKHKIQTRIIASDVAKEEEVGAIFHKVEDLDVNLVVISAGFGTSGLFHQSSLEQEVSMLRVNCEALLRVAHHFSAKFAEKKKGGIVLLSSLVAFQGVPYAAHYAATKAYVQSFGEALAEELRPFGVDVLCAAPGPVASGFGERAEMKMGMVLTPQQIGIPILEALGKKTTVLPGFLTKFLVGSLRTVPRSFKVKIMKKIMGGMTEHQRN